MTLKTGVLLLVAATALAQPVFRGPEIFPAEEFAARRTAVMAQIGDGVAIVLGFALKGNGAVWADDFSFDVVTDVPKTLLAVPNSLNFEHPD